MANSGDSYRDNISNESLQVLSHFAPEAPLKLNTYSRLRPSPSFGGCFVLPK